MASNMALMPLSPLIMTAGRMVLVVRSIVSCPVSDRAKLIRKQRRYHAKSQSSSGPLKVELDLTEWKESIGVNSFPFSRGPPQEPAAGN